MPSFRTRRHALAGVAVFLVADLVSRTTHAQGATRAAAPPTASSPGPSAEPYAPPVDPWNPRATSPVQAQPQAYPVPPPAGYAPYSPYLTNPYQGSDARNPYAAGGVYVELRTSTRNVRIDRVLSDGGMSIPVCMAPCRQVLPRNAVYVITGEGVRATSRFVLPDDRDQVTFDVQPGSSNQVVGGAVLMGGGLLVGYVGLLVLAASSIGDQETATSTSGGSTSNQGKTVGVTMLVGGGLAAAIGLYLILASHTSVSSSTGSHFSDTRRPGKGSRFALTARGLEF